MLKQVSQNFTAIVFYWLSAHTEQILRMVKDEQDRRSVGEKVKKRGPLFKKKKKKMLFFQSIISQDVISKLQIITNRIGL